MILVQFFDVIVPYRDRLTTTSVTQSPCYYGSLLILFVPEKRPYISLKRKKTVIRSLVNTANGHILKFQTIETFIISLR